MLHPHKWWAMTAFTVLAALAEIIPSEQQPVSLPPPPTPVTYDQTLAQEQRAALAQAESGSFDLHMGGGAGHTNDIRIPNAMLPRLMEALKMAAPKLEDTDDALDINDAASETLKLRLREEGKDPGSR
jgi:hypothetical protein